MKTDKFKKFRNGMVNFNRHFYHNIIKFLEEEIEYLFKSEYLPNLLMINMNVNNISNITTYNFYLFEDFDWGQYLFDRFLNINNIKDYYCFSTFNKPNYIHLQFNSYQEFIIYLIDLMIDYINHINLDVGLKFAKEMLQEKINKEKDKKEGE